MEDWRVKEEPLRIAVPETGENTHNYFEALEKLGARPHSVDASCDVNKFDGLLLPGGGDLHPQLYHTKVDRCFRMDKMLDARQLSVLDKFVKAGKPILGICRGHQLINVYFGGNLIQDIATRYHHISHCRTDIVHMAHAQSDSWLARLYGATEFSINSAHHQAVDHIGKYLRVIQWSDDNVPEAMVHEALPIYTVQWHPERMCFSHARGDAVDGSLVIRFFLNECAKYRKEKAS